MNHVQRYGQLIGVTSSYWSVLDSGFNKDNVLFLLRYKMNCLSILFNGSLDDILKAEDL